MWLFFTYYQIVALHVNVIYIITNIVNVSIYIKWYYFTILSKHGLNNNEINITHIVSMNINNIIIGSPEITM